MNITDCIDKLIGIQEAAEILGLKDKRVGQLLRARRLPGRFVGNRWIMYGPMIRRIARRRKRYHRDQVFS